MAEISLAFLWHQHQPYYPDDVAGVNPMPWVRLHGVKDYYGMALHLLEFPEMRCTINLVPSLLLQLQSYVDRKGSDRPLEISRIPAANLNDDEAMYLLDHFFMANLDSMIKPLPRYFELYLKRNLGKVTAERALPHFDERDRRDLQVLFNLAWIHPIAFERDSLLRQLWDKGRSFTEEDKALVLEKHFEILGQIIPLHKELQDRGQIEITTTPFYHPILPLLFDKKLARESLPQAKLPQYTSGYPEDAAVHVRRAVEYHTEVFGSPPRGMWPAEGSVCQEMIPLLAEHGIRWIATDEEILAHSTPHLVGRDEQGQIRSPSHLYRPYKVREGEAELGIVFRDHALSDRIGFHYQRTPGPEAANDLLRSLQTIRLSIEGDRSVLVTIILDGENCWEHYPDGGVSFLRTLYQVCTTSTDLKTVRIGDYLEQHPNAEVIPRLFAGSWIYHNFAIWIGHEEDNTAWDLLHRTREHLKSRGPSLPAAKLQQAWEEMYIAEGSDWFWWYGDDHSSPQDGLFDSLFRKHLENVYIHLGEPPPADLARPISQTGLRTLFTPPKCLLDVKVDGRESFFEWVNAGRYRSQDVPGSSMAMVTRGPIREIHFGFSLDHFFLRMDFERLGKHAVLEFESIKIRFVYPKEIAIHVHRPGRKNQIHEVHVEGEKINILSERVQIGIDHIIELAVPFEMLEVMVDQSLAFYVELFEGGQSRDRAPHQGTLEVLRPSENFDRIMWDV